MNAPPQLKPVDPVIAELQLAIAAAGCAQVDPSSLPIHEARDQQNRYFGFVNRNPVATGPRLDVAMPMGSAEVAARIYQPTELLSNDWVIFVRGAGWWAGDLDSHDNICRMTAQAMGCAVAAVDYRRSPEHTFPTQREDVVHAIRWLSAHRQEYGLGAGRIILWGESAGASLCVLAAQRLEQEGADTLLSALVLFYGNLGGPRENLRKQSKWVWQQYLGALADSPPDEAVPLKAKVASFPPVWLGVGDADPLIEDSQAFSQRLREAGILHALHVYPGMPHGFTVFSNVSEVAGQALRDAVSFCQQQAS